MAKDQSFDVVSHVDMQEVDNAVQQATKELVQRYDLKDTGSKIELDKPRGDAHGARAERLRAQAGHRRAQHQAHPPRHRPQGGDRGARRRPRPAGRCASRQDRERHRRRDRAQGQQGHPGPTSRRSRFRSRVTRSASSRRPATSCRASSVPQGAGLRHPAAVRELPVEPRPAHARSDRSPSRTPPSSS